MKTIILGSGILLLSSTAAALAPDTLTFLPLGGSPIAEAGIVLSVTFCIVIAFDAFKK